MKRWQAYAALAVTVALWGGSFVGTKVALRELGPAAITVVRFAMGVALLAAATALRGGLRLPLRRDVPLLALLGFIGIMLHQWLQATGLETASATITSWIVATIPVFVALLGWAALRERLGGGRLGGILLAAAGVVGVVSNGRPLELLAGRVGSVGDLLVAGSAVNWAVFTVLSKYALDRRRPGETAGRPIEMMLYVMAFGWLFSLGWLAIAGGWQAIPALSSSGWWALAFLGVGCSGLAYFLWYAALDAVDATQAGVFLYFGPLVTAALAWPLLGEKPTLAVALGGAAILAGVWLVNRQEG